MSTQSKPYSVIVERFAMNEQPQTTHKVHNVNAYSAEDAVFQVGLKLPKDHTTNNDYSYVTYKIVSVEPNAYVEKKS